MERFLRIARYLYLLSCCRLVFKRRQVALNDVCSDHCVCVDPMCRDRIRFLFHVIRRVVDGMVNCRISVMQFLSRWVVGEAVLLYLWFLRSVVANRLLFYRVCFSREPNLPIGFRIFGDFLFVGGRAREDGASFGVLLCVVSNGRVVALVYFCSIKDRELIECWWWYANEGIINGTAAGRDYDFRISHRDPYLFRVFLRYVVVFPGATINDVCNANPVITTFIAS